MPEVHAVLSASASKRWISCPPSVRLELSVKDILPPDETDYAAEGTIAHALAELKLRRLNGDAAAYEAGLPAVKASSYYNAEMERYTDDYVDVISEKLFKARDKDPYAVLLIEQRLDFSHLVPHGFGTGDAVIIGDGSLEVCDLKYGKGVPVSAIENPQARLYGIGAYNMLSCVYDIDSITNTIIQPRLSSVTEETLSVEDLLNWGETVVKPAAELAWKGEGEFKTGEHCRFCLAKAVCAKRASEALATMDELLMHGGKISDADIPRLLRVIPQAKDWMSDIETYAKSLALNGTKWQGWKLVRGRKGNRKFTDEEEVQLKLAAAGYEQDIYSERKLKGLTAIEKAIGKEGFKSLLSEYIYQAEGSLTLVPEEDPREQVSTTDVEFGDMINK